MSTGSREQAASDWLNAWYDPLRAFAGAVAPSDMDPDDVLHDALLRVLPRVRQGGVQDVGPYARSAIVNAVRSRQRRQVVSRRVLRSLASRRVSDSAATEDSGTGVREALVLLESLEPIDRALLWLVIVEGRPAPEAAEAMSMSHDAARQRLSRARRRLASSERAQRQWNDEVD